MRRRPRDIPFLLFVGACAAAILACCAYLAYHYYFLPRAVAARNADYAALYVRATPAPTEELPEARDEPLPDGSSPAIVYAAPTPPPVRDSFSGLLKINPETVGFLEIGDLISLPVVQRENDNGYYLTHDFSGAESDEGCLFLDGVNRLEYGDSCLIVYGHNMKNGSMFGKLTDFAIAGVLRKNAIVRFDTLYEDGAYVPFACFALDASAVDFRKYQFTEDTFAEFASLLKSQSQYDIPVGVEYGDRLLLLVTCDYSVDDGRFLVALRGLRAGETEEGARALVEQAKEKK